MPLRALLEASLEFRLAFRFSQVSLISMHNQVNLGFRQALGLDRMLADLSADVAEATAHLTQVQRTAVANRQQAADRREAEAEGRLKREQEKLEFLVVFGAIAVFGAALYNDVELYFTDRTHSGLQALEITVAVTAAVYLVSIALNLRAKRRARERGWRKHETANRKTGIWE